MKLKELYRKATPLPWSANDHGHIKDTKARTIAAINVSNTTFSEGDANKAIIAHAVNVLPELVEALEKCNPNYPPGSEDTDTRPAFTITWGTVRAIQAAIKKANHIEIK